MGERADISIEKHTKSPLLFCLISWASKVLILAVILNENKFNVPRLRDWWNVLGRTSTIWFENNITYFFVFNCIIFGLLKGEFKLFIVTVVEFIELKSSFITEWLQYWWQIMSVTKLKMWLTDLTFATSILHLLTSTCHQFAHQCAKLVTNIL